MNKNKEIIKACPNYFHIISFHSYEDDIVTNKIIAIYKEYIFNIDMNDESSVNEIKELDAALGKYITDYAFRSEVQKAIMAVKIKKDSSNILKSFVDVILKTYVNYEDFTTRVIYISRWI